MKKILIITLLIAILFLPACIKKQTPTPEKRTQITLSEIGQEGKLDDTQSAYEILDMYDYDVWVLYIKKDRLISQLKASQAYTVSVKGQDYLLKQNPFNANIYKLLLPSSLQPEDVANLMIKTTNTRGDGLIKKDIPLSIERIYITKGEKNGTQLNEITVEDYTDMYADEDKTNFAYSNGQFIRPSHVKSNEENAYEVNTYFDARTVAETESATGAFQFLKDEDNYEQYIIMENPNRFTVTGAATELLAPDDRWRVRQLGSRGELNGGNVFNIIDDTTNNQFVLSIDTDTLPATYSGTIFWMAQFKESTQTQFEENGQTNIVEMTIPYSDAPSTELVLNSRFLGVENKILLFDENGTYKQDFESLNAAVEAAESKETIKITGGTVVSPSNTEAKITGTIEINGKALSITSLDGETVTLDGEEKQQGFNIIGNANVTIEKLRIINFEMPQSDNQGRDDPVVPTASAINVSESILTIRYTLFASNTSECGAVSGVNNSQITIEDATFTTNAGTNLNGSGALLIDTSELNLSDSCFASNTTADSGGALILKSASATITGSQFIQNQADIKGAGIFADESTLCVDDCIFDGNYFTAITETEGFGTGIYLTDLIAEGAKVTNSSFKNMQARQGAGIYIKSNELTLYGNGFENLETEAGGAVYNEYVPTLYNSDGTQWKWFNVPEESVDFVENSTNNVNIYINCTINGNEETEGAKISHMQRTTPKGTLTLRPESGEENLTITVNIDYLIGREFHGGTLTIDIPAEFNVTDSASVIIGENEVKPASVYHHTTQSIDITGINLEEGTVTLRLEEQDIPDGGDPETVVTRDLDYNFTGRSDADGHSGAWDCSELSQAVFTSLYVSKNTDIQIMEGMGYLDLIYDATDEATRIKYATGTTVDSLTSRLESMDGSEQTYEIETPEGTLNPAETLPEEATLTVMSEWGSEFSQAYTIYSCSFKLTLEDNTITWYRTAQEAINAVDSSESGVIEIFQSKVQKDSQIVIDNKEVLIKPGEAVVDVTFDGNNTHRVFYITNGASVTMNNLHITKGTTVTGAGLRVEDSQLTMEKCLVDLNYTTTVESGNKGRGGGILGSKSTLSFFNTTFASNTADGSGGGLRISESTVEIADSTITNNKSHLFGGGGVYLSYSNVSITNVLVAANSGTYGGGLYDNASTIDILESEFNNNTCSTFGGAVFTYGSTITIRKTLIDSNQNTNGTFSGGGLAFQHSNATVTESTITNNTAQNGGGIALLNPLNLPAPIKTTILYSNVITDNTANESGGGIYIEIKNGYPEPVLLNADGIEWRQFNAPVANPAFIEHNTIEASNNTYSGNSASGEEGGDIYFDYQTIPQTPAGTLILSPEEAQESDTVSINVNFKTGAYLRNASLTVHIPDEFGLTSDDASITFNGQTNRAADYGAQAGQNPFTIDVLEAAPEDVLTISLESTPIPAAGNYQFQVYADADGTGTAWRDSVGAMDQFVSK